MNLKRTLLLALALSSPLAGSKAQSPITFTPNTFVLGDENSGPDCVAVADVNGDGTLDLISANYGFRWAMPGDPGGWNTNVVVLTNDGSGGFAINASVPVGRGPSSVAAADVNGDGRPDLVCANETDNSLTVLINNGSGVLTSNATLTVGSRPHGLAVADFNRDRQLDLACVNAGANTVTVLTGQGGGAFAFSATVPVGNEPLALVARDVNDDRWPDLITANKTDDSLTVLTNDGLGGFVFSATLPVGHFPDWVSAADFNGDGKPDLVSVNWGAATMTVLTNSGAGGFGFNATLGVGNYPSSVAAADFNGDGKVDLICASTEANSLSVLTNNGSGVFGYNTTLGTGRIPNVWPADFNNDGKLDLACPNFRDGTVTVLLNTTAFAPAAGQPPAGLVGWWPGDGHTYDFSSSHYHGTLAGTTAYRSGIAGQAFDCHGSGNDVLVGDMAGLHFVNDFSFAAWLNPRAVGVSLLDPVVGREGEYMMFLMPNHHLGVGLANKWPGWGTEAWRVVDSGFEVPTNAWTHAAVVYSRSVLRIYVNGVLRTTLACDGDVGDYWVASNQFRIGGRQMNAWEYFYDGLVDEACVFNRPLSAEEVAALYAAGTAGWNKPATYLPAGLIAWWRAEGDMLDSIGTHHGSGSTAPTFAPGRFGQAFHFDGTNQSVMIPDGHADLDGWMQFTLEAWVNLDTTRDSPGPGQCVISKVGNHRGPYAGNFGYQFGFANGATKLFCQFNTDSLLWPGYSTSADLLGPVSTNVWYHVAATYDHDAVKLYLNGEPLVTNVIGPVTIANTIATLRLSKDDNDNVAFAGRIDDARIYNRALTEAEVAALAGRITLVNANCLGTNFTFAFQTVSDLGYRVEYNDDLNTTNWVFHHTLTGNGSLLPCAIPMTNRPQRFFRVRLNN